MTEPTHAMPGWTGRTLGGRYLLEQEVGHGGFGVVFRARHLVLDAPVAIKALHPARLGGTQREALIEATMREAKLLARLRHPAIVSVLDGGYEEDAALGIVPWFAMEWCDGETLENELVRRRGRGGRPISEVLTLMRPVLEAVAFGHAQGIAHRDLKPANIMLVRGATGVTARVLDFGLAKQLGQNESAPSSGATQTVSSERAFTPAYASPEQLAGGRTGPWTDVHALGLVLGEVLMDRPCYARETFYVDATAAVRPTPGRHGFDVGPWEAPLQRALALHPAERFGDAGDLLRTLTAAADPRGLDATAAVATRTGDGPRASNPNGPSPTQTDVGPTGPVAPTWMGAATGGGSVGGTAPTGAVTQPSAQAGTSAVSVLGLLVALLALAGVGGIGWWLWAHDGLATLTGETPASGAGAQLRTVTVEALKRTLSAKVQVTGSTTTTAPTFVMTHITVDTGDAFGGVTLYVMQPGISDHAIITEASKASGVALAKDANVLLQVGLYRKPEGTAGDPLPLLRHILASHPGRIVHPAP